MRLLQNWTRASMALVVLSGAAFADVTVSQSNDPTATLGGRMVSLLGAEKSALDRVAPERMAALTDGIAVPKQTRKMKTSGLQSPAVIRYDAEFLAAQPAAAGDEQWQCLAQALYHESRGETIKGQFAVAEVILNRVDSPRYPSSICSVVHQGGKRACQFSFTCDGNSDRIREPAAYVQAGKIARLMLDGAPRALTEGATHFHTVNVRPGWARKFPKTASIGMHVFYRQPLGS